MVNRSMLVDIVRYFFVNDILEHILLDSALTAEHRVYPVIHDAIHLQLLLRVDNIHQGYLFPTRSLLVL